MIASLLLLASMIHPFATSAHLTQHAQIRVEQICKTQEFSHRLFWSTQTWDFGHLKYAWYAENLAQGYPDATSTMVAWLNSPEHLRNLVDPRFSAIGIASKNCGGKLGIVTVELFGGYGK